MRRLIGLAILICTAGIPALSQAPASPESVFRITVDLVQVDAVVTDSKGRHVADLRPSDFQLLVDGKPRQLTNFSYIDAGPKATPAPTTASTAAPARKPRREEIHRTIVFVVDDLHISPEYMASLLPVVKKFVDEQVAPGDLVSVMATRSSMGIYEQFTSDKRQLYAAMDRLVRRVGQSFDQINPDDKVSSRDNGSSSFFMELYQTMAVATLSRAIEGLREMSGRKAIAFLSDGIEFPLSQLVPVVGVPNDPAIVTRMMERMAKVAELANQSGVVFYTFDTKGLEAMLMPSRRVNLMGFSSYLARETGGVFTHDTNGLSGALGKAMLDMTGYYLLGYRPAPGEFGVKGGKEISHKIQVKVLRSGLTVRSRKFYTGVEEPMAQEPQTREEILRRALFSPFDTGGIRVRLSLLYTASAPAAKTGDRRPLLRAMLAIDGRDLRFTNTADGMKEAVLDVVTAAYSVDGKLVSNQDQRFTLQLPARQAEVLAASGAAYKMDIGVPKPGIYQVRTVVRDAASGSAGSASTYLQIPDFNQQRIALSSLVLSDGTDTTEGGGWLTASREFVPGQQLYYLCRVYGVQPDKITAKQAVEVDVRLFREGVRVFASDPITVSGEPDERELTVAGSVRLPLMFPEGEYAMQLTAHDRLAAPKQREASQWIDFTVAR